MAVTGENAAVCQKCGKSVGDSNFCPHCGAKVEKIEIEGVERPSAKFEPGTRERPYRKGETASIEMFGGDLRIELTLVAVRRYFLEELTPEVRDTWTLKDQDLCRASFLVRVISSDCGHLRPSDLHFSSVTSKGVVRPPLMSEFKDEVCVGGELTEPVILTVPCNDPIPQIRYDGPDGAEVFFSTRL